MSDYNLSLTGAQVNSALNKVHNADATPTDGSTNMITSDAVHDAVNSIDFNNLDSSIINTNIAAGVSGSTLPTSEAVKTYVDSNAPQTLSTGYTLLSQDTSTTTGTATADGFLLIMYRPVYTGTRALYTISIGNVTFPQYESDYRASNWITLPIANGESYDIEILYADTERVYFKAYS